MSILKVVHVVEALGGGVYTYFKDLSFFFGDNEIRESIDTTIIYSGNRKEIDPKRMHEEFSKGVSLLAIDMIRNFSPLQDLKSVVKLTQELRRLNPDVIHLHSSKAGFLGRIACFLLFKKKKIFYTPHAYAFLRTDISKLTRNFYWIIEKLFPYFFKGETIACGDSEYEIAQTIGKSHLVRNGINIEEVKTHFSENKNEVITIGIVARIAPIKNPKLFNQIAIKYPHFNFVWIGGGELMSELTATNIRITGWLLDRNEVLKELNNIDVYLQTSLWEGLPIAVLEAMAMQKPILATNIIGNKDIVVPNETGFLFDNIHELSAYLEILKNEEIRKDFGKNGLKRCFDVFDVNQNFKKLVAIYNQ